LPKNRQWVRGGDNRRVPYELYIDGLGAVFGSIGIADAMVTRALAD